MGPPPSLAYEAFSPTSGEKAAFAGDLGDFHFAVWRSCAVRDGFNAGFGGSSLLADFRVHTVVIANRVVIANKTPSTTINMILQAVGIFF